MTNKPYKESVGYPWAFRKLCSSKGLLLWCRFLEPTVGLFRRWSMAWRWFFYQNWGNQPNLSSCLCRTYRGCGTLSNFKITRVKCFAHWFLLENTRSGVTKEEVGDFLARRQRKETFQALGEERVGRETWRAGKRAGGRGTVWQGQEDVSEVGWCFLLA